MISRQKKFIVIIVSIISGIILLNIIFSHSGTRTTNLIMWGFYDSPDTINPIIRSFTQQFPNINITYIQKDPNNYYNELILAFANNKAPDIFMLPGNWIPTFQDKIIPLNLNKDKEINLATIDKIYPLVVKQDLVFNNQLMGMPISIDTLALYYNKDIFYNNKIALPPNNWSELLSLIPKLKKIDAVGGISKSAIALGTSDNVQWANDILASLMMQYGSSIVDVNKKQATFGAVSIFGGKQIIAGEEALKEYTQFADPRSQYVTWGNYFYNDIEAFLTGKTAMIISYNLIQSKLQTNPNLHYGITNFPLIDSNNKQYYGRTINLVVAKTTKNSKEAWSFLKYWANPKINQLYFSLSKNIPPRLDVNQTLLNDPIVGVFASQIPFCRSWYQFNYNKIAVIFSKMINDIIIAHLDYSNAVKTAVDRINLEWQK